MTSSQYKHGDSILQKTHGQTDGAETMCVIIFCIFKHHTSMPYLGHFERFNVTKMVAFTKKIANI